MAEPANVRSTESPFTDEQIEFMRADLDSGMGLTKMIMFAKKRLEAEGRDFDKEFEKWKEHQMSDSAVNVHNMELFIDMAQPGSGCELSEGMDIVAFKGLYEMTSGNVCNGCAYEDRCEFLKKASGKVKEVTSIR